MLMCFNGGEFFLRFIVVYLLILNCLCMWLYVDIVVVVVFYRRLDVFWFINF